MTTEDLDVVLREMPQPCYTLICRVFCVDLPLQAKFLWARHPADLHCNDSVEIQARKPPFLDTLEDLGLPPKQRTSAQAAREKLLKMLPNLRCHYSSKQSLTMLPGLDLSWILRPQPPKAGITGVHHWGQLGVTLWSHLTSADTVSYSISDGDEGRRGQVGSELPGKFQLEMWPPWLLSFHTLQAAWVPWDDGLGRGDSLCVFTEPAASVLLQSARVQLYQTWTQDRRGLHGSVSHS